MSNAEIAAALYITAGTAKTHVARLPKDRYGCTAGW
jgi:DNA-binding CsgD family transcriptional regulator